MSPEANKAYYLYGIEGSIPGSIQLMVDTNYPDVGIDGINDWTYLGAFATLDNAPPDPVEIVPFISVNGRCIFDAELNKFKYKLPDSQWKKIAISNMPMTISHAYVEVSGVLGDPNPALIQVSGTQYKAGASAVDVNTKPPHDDSTESYGWVPVFYPPNLYIKANDKPDTQAQLSLMGWREDPTIWK